MFALIATALAVIVISSVLRDEPTTPNRPQITGPTELVVDESGTWTHENRPDVSYRWTLPSGESSTDTSVEWTPTEAEPFTIRLTATDANASATADIAVTVIDG